MHFWTGTATSRRADCLIFKILGGVILKLKRQDHVRRRTISSCCSAPYSCQVKLMISPKQRAKPKTSARKTGRSMPPYLSGIVAYEVDQTVTFHCSFMKFHFPVTIFFLLPSSPCLKLPWWRHDNVTSTSFKLKLKMNLKIFLRPPNRI